MVITRVNNATKPWGCLMGLVAGAVALHIALVWFAAGGLRGSDQFWYCADVESILQGRFTTNHVYPVNLWKNDPIPPPFIHNILNLYLVVPFAGLTGSGYSGWILANLTASLLTAYLLWRLLRKLGDERAAAIGATAFLLLPQTVWLTGQASAEATTTFVMTGALYVWTKAEGRFREWLAVVVLLGMAVYCRAVFAPLLIIAPLFYLRTRRPRQWTDWVRALALLLASLALLWLKERLLATGGPTIGDVVVTRSSIDGLMAPYMVWSLPSFDGVGLVRHGFGELVKLVWPAQIAEYAFYIPGEALIVLGIVFWADSHTGMRWGAKWFTTFLLFITVAVIFLHANLPRFLHVLLPGLMVLVLPRLLPAGRSVRYVWILTLAIGLAAVSLPFARHSRLTGVRESRQWSQAAEYFNARVPTSDAVLCGDIGVGGNGIQIAWALRPRLLFYFEPKRTEPERFAELRRRLAARWLLDGRDSGFARLSGAVADSVKPPPPMDSYVLWRLRDVSADQVRMPGNPK